MLPNLLVIGAQKSGTTWLHRRLGAHPDVFMSTEKELSYFNQPQPLGRISDYEANFADAGDRRIVGETTPGYFWTYDAAAPYCRMNGARTNLAIPAAARELLGEEIKLIAILRQPVQRAVSAYLHHFRMGRIAPAHSILKAGRRAGIIDMGFYRRHLACWEATFGDGRVLVLFFDDIAERPQALWETVTAHLGVPPIDIPGFTAPEHGGFRLVERDAALTIDVDDPHSRRLLPAGWPGEAPLPRITQSDLQALQDLYQDDMAWLLNRYGRSDLPWLDVPWSGPRG